MGFFARLDCPNIRFMFAPSSRWSPVRIHNWPDNQDSSPKLASQRPVVNHSKKLTATREVVIGKAVAKWTKTVQVAPLTETLPYVKLRARLIATFEDGTKETIVDEQFDWEL